MAKGKLFPDRKKFLNERLLTFTASDHPVQLDCELKLDELYRTSLEREEFEKRLDSFFHHDKDACRIYQLNGDRLRYRTEHLIPTRKEPRTPLMLIFGNPASRSITSGMFFSPEKYGGEHRFWKHLLGPAGIEGLSMKENLSISDRNKKRMDLLMGGHYGSNFSVGLCVYISMPSSAGGPWSGVAGIKKLLGKQAFERVVEEERRRVLKEAGGFLMPNGLGVAFQKDAWDGLSSDQGYTLERARVGQLQSSFNGMPEIPIYGVPPTRLLGASRDILSNVLGRFRRGESSS